MPSLKTLQRSPHITYVPQKAPCQAGWRALHPGPASAGVLHEDVLIELALHIIALQRHRHDVDAFTAKQVRVMVVRVRTPQTWSGSMQRRQLREMQQTFTVTL